MLAEDHVLVRKGFRSILEQIEEFKIAGEANNGLEVLTILEKGIEVDIILADINMPEMDGLILSRILKESYPNIKVIVLSMLDHEKYILEAFESGVQGYLLKSSNSLELEFAIRHVCSGNNYYLCSELGMRMFRQVTRAYKKPENEGDQVHTDLTQRELEVLDLIAEGYTNNQIAEKLFTSRRTVEGHRQSLIDKTGAQNTAALIQYAFRSGILK